MRGDPTAAVMLNRVVRGMSPIMITVTRKAMRTLLGWTLGTFGIAQVDWLLGLFREVFGVAQAREVAAVWWFR